VNPQDKETKLKVTRDTLLVILKCKAPDKRERPSLHRPSDSSGGLKSTSSTLPVLAGVFEVPLVL
jgi:hypothetical protein